MSIVFTQNIKTQFFDRTFFCLKIKKKKKKKKKSPCYCLLMCLKTCWTNGNQWKPYETWRSAASDMCLRLSVCPNTLGKYRIICHMPGRNLSFQQQNINLTFRDVNNHNYYTSRQLKQCSHDNFEKLRSSQKTVLQLMY